MYKICTTIYGKRILIRDKDLLKMRASYGLIINNGYILLVKVKSTGKLWFPGGLLEGDELERDALYREAFEETGSKIMISKKLLEVENCFYYDNNKEARLQRSSFYICSTKDRKMREYNNRDLLDEAIAPKWYKITELKEKDMQDYAFLILKKLGELDQSL